MAATHDERLTASEVRTAFSALGLTIGPSSPLAGLPAAATLADPETLRGRGLLDEPWRGCLEALPEPDRWLRTLIPAPDATAVTGYYGTPSMDDGLVGCWPEDGRMRISFPHQMEDHVLKSCAVLMADRVRGSDPFTTSLSPAALAAFAGVVDVLRAQMLGSILSRRGTTGTDFDLSVLRQAYSDGMAASDARWVVTLLRLLMPMSVQLPAQLPDAGLAELTSLGLVEVNGERVQPGEALCRVAAFWKTPLPALAHEAGIMEAGRLRDYRYLISIRGDGPICSLAFSRDDHGQARILVECQSGTAFRTTLRRMVQPLYEAPRQPAAPPEQTPAPRFCSQCGQPLQPGSGACAQCGFTLAVGPS